jgi:hypothetical protein
MTPMVAAGRRKMRPPVRARDALQPALAVRKWWLLGGLVLVLGLWQAAFHHWFMRLPMELAHQMDFAIGAGLVAVTALAFLIVIQRREAEAASVTKLVWELDDSLRAGIGEQRGDLARATELLNEVRAGLGPTDRIAEDRAEIHRTRLNHAICLLEGLSRHDDRLQNLVSERMRSSACGCGDAGGAVPACRG